MLAVGAIAAAVGIKMRSESAHKRIDRLIEATDNREKVDENAHKEINRASSAQIERLHRLESWSARAEEQIAAIRSDVAQLRDGQLRSEAAIEKHMERLYTEQREITKAIARITE